MISIRFFKTCLNSNDKYFGPSFYTATYFLKYPDFNKVSKCTKSHKNKIQGPSKEFRMFRNVIVSHCPTFILKANFSKKPGKKIFSLMAGKLNLSFFFVIKFKFNFPVIKLKIFLAGFLEKFALKMATYSVCLLHITVIKEVVYLLYSLERYVHYS